MDLGEIWKLVTSAGPFASALLMYLYLDERAERRSKDKELHTVLGDSIKVIIEVRQTMDMWLTAFNNSGRQD